MTLKELREQRKQEYLASLPTNKEFKAMSLKDKMSYISARDFEKITAGAKKRRSFLGKMLMGASACAAFCAGVCGVMTLSDAYQYKSASMAVKAVEPEIQQAQRDVEYYEKAPLLVAIQSDNYSWALQQRAEAQSIKKIAQSQMVKIEASQPVNKNRMKFCLALAGVLGGLGLTAKFMPVAKNRAAYKAFVMKRARGCRAREHSLL